MNRVMGRPSLGFRINSVDMLKFRVLGFEFRVVLPIPNGSVDAQRVLASNMGKSMSTIRKFEDLLVWQKARILTKEIYQIGRETSLKKDFALKGQIQRSAGSVMDNIAEGFERDGNKEFCQFLSISKGSIGEVKSQLYRCFDADYINESAFQKLYAEADTISRMIGSLLKKLRDSPYKGKKFK